MNEICVRNRHFTHHKLYLCRPRNGSCISQKADFTVKTTALPNAGIYSPINQITDGPIFPNKKFLKINYSQMQNSVLDWSRISKINSKRIQRNFIEPIVPKPQTIFSQSATADTIREFLETPLKLRSPTQISRISNLFQAANRMKAFNAEDCLEEL
jgi:hypothetical protein